MRFGAMALAALLSIVSMAVWMRFLSIVGTISLAWGSL
jgi:hypothetical protein